MSKTTTIKEPDGGVNDNHVKKASLPSCKVGSWSMVSTQQKSPFYPKNKFQTKDYADLP